METGEDECIWTRTGCGRKPQWSVKWQEGVTKKESETRCGNRDGKMLCARRVNWKEYIYWQAIHGTSNVQIKMYWHYSSLQNGHQSMNPRYHTFHQWNRSVFGFANLRQVIRLHINHVQGFTYSSKHCLHQVGMWIFAVTCLHMFVQWWQSQQGNV